MVGIAAVFDGHNGAEASDMASRLLLDYFALHINFLLDATFSSMTTTRKLLIGRLPSNADHPVIPLRDEIMHLYNLDANMQFSSFFHLLAFSSTTVLFSFGQIIMTILGFFLKKFWQDEKRLIAIKV